jgi:hypothetical protein
MAVVLTTAHADRNEDGTHLYTVGFFDPKGVWVAESDYPTPERGAQRVHFLNGGNLYRFD